MCLVAAACLILSCAHHCGLVFLSGAHMARPGQAQASARIRSALRNSLERLVVQETMELQEGSGMTPGHKTTLSWYTCLAYLHV